MASDRIESLSERRELSEAAKALLADKAFDYAIRELRRLWFSQLVNYVAIGPKQDELVSKLRALEEIPNLLANFLTDYREAAKREARNAS